MSASMEFSCELESGMAGILSALDRHGVATFAVYALKASPVRGTELFNRMMRAFGDDVRAIAGVQRKGKDPSINIDRMNELTGSGMTFEEAITKTWTATRAAKYGFVRVRIVENPIGSPGAYTAIDVLFEKEGG